MARFAVRDGGKLRPRPNRLPIDQRASELSAFCGAVPCN